ncbi:GxxExxY protein [Bacteroides sp. 224]|uniref:GxxExxY protein n=1 Tax=Bacteroides sp. 224 TaxID=2302936 RepID=UPI0013D59CB2|nr:hypothetical protein [Bacteroides sp. 224]
MFCKFGLLESTYEACLCYELEKENLFFEKQKELPVIGPHSGDFSKTCIAPS